MPVYNGERYLAEAMESIIKQSEKDFELIVVNDCSTDSTVSIVEGYKKRDKRIKLINNLKNLKLPASLNKGFSYAKGDLFTWTSDDNIFYPQMLCKLKGKINEGYEFVYGDMDYIGANGEILPNISHIGECVWYSNYVGACFMYTRKAYEAVGEYDTTAFLVEDYDYWLRILSKYEFGFINEKLYGYRLHDDSLTGSRQKDIARKRIELLYKYLKSSEVDSDIKDKIRVQLADTYYDLGERVKVREYVGYLKKHNYGEFIKTRKSTRLNYYFSKEIIEKIRKIKKR